MSLVRLSNHQYKQSHISVLLHHFDSDIQARAIDSISSTGFITMMIRTEYT
jgi:hypothetical protein